jgi:murein DD-endopeptidase MepM/ murein hydrolase activator NlpD
MVRIVLIIGLFFIVSSCREGPPRAPYAVANITPDEVILPPLIIATKEGIKEIRPAVWNEKSQTFTKGTDLNVKVEKEDTVYKISRRYHIPIKTIIEANNLKAPFSLKHNQELSLGSPKVHIVKKGETLNTISDKHKTDVTALVKLNKLEHPYIIKVGQQLLLPGKIQYLPPKDTFISVKETKEKIVKSGFKKVSNKVSKQEKITYDKPKSRSSSIFLRPVKGKVISYFGPKKGGLQNDGMNIAAKAGTPVKSAENGVIVYVGNEIESFGNMILVKHSDGWISAYGHLGKTSVSKGQHVSRGTKLGTVGSTGYVKQPQLHFELRKGHRPVNPGQYITK